VGRVEKGGRGVVRGAGGRMGHGEGCMAAGVSKQHFCLLVLDEIFI